MQRSVVQIGVEAGILLFVFFCLPRLELKGENTPKEKGGGWYVILGGGGRDVG